MPVTSPTIADLTAATLTGNGVFDVLMRANKAHLEDQFEKGRIKGTEYATVYLGSLEQVLQNSVQFLLNKDKAANEALLIAKQIELADKQILKSTAEIALVEAQTANAEAELAIIQANALKVPAEVALLGAQKLKVDAEKLGTEAETLFTTQKKTNLIAEALNIPKQGSLIDAQSAQATQQTLNLASQKLHVEAQTLLVTQQKANAIIEGTVLTATKCKLDAEYDVLMETKLKTGQETALLTWKVTTEKAQTSDVGVAENSVIGKQKILYQRQADGFVRDAEQKAAKIMVDSWNVRRTTDEGTVADGTNKLNDPTVGRAVEKLLTGVGA